MSKSNIDRTSPQMTPRRNPACAPPCLDHDNSPLRHCHPARTLVICVVSANLAVVPAKAGTSHPCPPIARVGDRECNQMQPNATELKVLPLLATPDEANHGHSQGQPAQCLRVSGVPNETTVASFPTSRLGINEAKQGQMGPRFNPRRLREGGNLVSPARVDDGEWVDMEANGSELKVSPLLATPNPAPGSVIKAKRDPPASFQPRRWE